MNQNQVLIYRRKRSGNALLEMYLKGVLEELRTGRAAISKPEHVPEIEEANELLSIKQIEEQVHISRRTITRYIRNGVLIPACKYQRVNFFYRKDVKEFSKKYWLNR